MGKQETIPQGIHRDPLIEMDKLTKKFDEVTALDGVSFGLRQGEFFGFLVPNGAGKSTTINIFTGLASPNSGTIRVGGLDCTRRPTTVQHIIGVVPDESNLYPELSGFDNLCFCGALYGMHKDESYKRAQDLLKTFGLMDAAGRKFAGYSKGMKRKLTIAAGIIHYPQILFLDEPTTGIYAAGARQIRQLIADLHGSGTTIFLTTHYIEEAEQLYERIAFIVRGQIVRIDTVDNLLHPMQDRHIMLISVGCSGMTLSADLALAFPDLEFQAVSTGQVRIKSEKPFSVGPLVRFIEEQGTKVMGARRLWPSLEEVFVRVTGIEVGAMKKEKEKARGGL